MCCVKESGPDIMTFIIKINKGQDIVLGHYEDSKNADECSDTLSGSKLFWDEISDIAD
jgi:hypothetical protein